MKKTVGILGSLFALYMIGYTTLEKKKKLDFYGNWNYGKKELRFSYSGVFIYIQGKWKNFGYCTYQVLDTIPKECILENMVDAHAYRIHIQFLHDQNLSAVCVVNKDSLYWKNNDMNVFEKYRKNS